MKFLTTLLLFSLLIIGSLAIPIKDNEKEVQQLLKEKKQIVNDHLNEFLNAKASGVVEKIQEYLKTLVKTQKRAHDNLLRILPGLEKIIATMDYLSKDRFEGNRFAHSVARMLESAALKVLTALVDGNRDNVSYYMYDAAQEWIQKRVEKGTPGPELPTLEAKLKEARKLIVTARDSLDDNAQVFVKTIKEVKRLSGNTSGDNWKKIQEQIGELVKATKSVDLRKLSQAAMDKVIEIEKDPK